MSNISASHNSRFFGVRRPGELLLFRGINRDISHRVNDRMAGKLICLGNNGDAFFRNGTNVYRLRREKGVKADRPRALAHMDGSEEGGRLGGLAVNVDGRELCYEQLLPAQTLSSRLRLPWGKQKPSDDKAVAHRLIITNASSPRQQTAFYETIVDGKKCLGMKWAASPTFGFLIVAEAAKKGETIFKLIDIVDESVCSEFVLSSTGIRSLHVSDNGTVVIEVRTRSEHTAVIWTYSQDRSLVNIPERSVIHHFSKNKLVFVTEDGRHLVAKSHHDQLLTQVDLSPLVEFGLDYLLHFTEKDDIQLATFTGSGLRIHHTDLEALPIDAKRWKLLQEQKRLQEEETAVDEIVERQRKEKERMEALEKSRLLQAAVQAPKGPTPVLRPPTERVIESPAAQAPPAVIEPPRKAPSRLSFEPESVPAAAEPAGTIPVPSTETETEPARAAEPAAAAQAEHPTLPLEEELILQPPQRAVGGSTIDMPETELPVPNTELPVPNTELPVPNTELPVPETELPVPNTELPEPKTEGPAFLRPPGRSETPTSLQPPIPATPSSSEAPTRLQPPVPAAGEAPTTLQPPVPAASEAPTRLQPDVPAASEAPTSLQPPGPQEALTVAAEGQTIKTDSRSIELEESQVEEAAEVVALSPEEALERLRMEYIAGELARDEYYRRKAELEAGEDSEALKVAPKTPKKARPLTQGRRIELKLDGD